MKENKEYLKQLRDLWADEPACEDDSPPCSALDFDVLTPPVSVSINKLRTQWDGITFFMEAGGELYERHIRVLGRTMFAATRNEKEIIGYGETPYEAFCMWLLETNKE